MNLDGLSLSPLVAELNARLAGARIDRIFQPDKYTLIIWLRQLGETLPLLISANPEFPRICLPEAIPENPAVPPTFTMLLRKHIEDGRIGKIEQAGLDRIVTMSVDIRGERGLIFTKQLTVEIMGKHSNIIFVQDGVIIDSIKRVGFGMSRVRQVLPGKEYIAPPAQLRANPLLITGNEFADLVRQHPAGKILLTKALIETAMGLGPLSAREIAWRAGFPADMTVETIDDADTVALSEAIDSVILPLSRGETKPTIVLSATGGKLLALAAFHPEHLGDQQIMDFSSMSAAVEFAAGFQGKPENPEKNLLQKLLATETAKQTRKEAALLGEIADAGKADVLRCKADILMSNLPSITPGISQISLPNLYSDDPNAESITITLNPLNSPMDNIRHYYTKYNKMKRAQESLSVQLQECRTEIAYLDSIAVALENSISFDDINEIRRELTQAGYLKDTKKRPTQKPSAPLSARTADGISILVGKNNRQNDLVTFKQAQPDDLWFHTKDIPGSRR